MIVMRESVLRMARDDMSDVEIRQTGVVLTVALNRPETHNAMTPDMIQELGALFGSLPERDDVRAVVLTGNGRSFCATI